MDRDRFADLHARIAELRADVAALAARAARPPAGDDWLDVDVLDLADALMASDPTLTRADAMLTAWWESGR